MSPSSATDQATRDEWRELGFYYEVSNDPPFWRIVGSRSGLSRFVSLLEEYVSDQRNEVLSEHEHYGPYMYFKITTWTAPEIDRDGIRGALADLRRLKALVESKLSNATVGGAFEISSEYTKGLGHPLCFEIREDHFDPASEDPNLSPAG